MSAPIIARTTAGKEVCLRKLAIADIIDLCEVVYQREQAALLDRLNVSGVAPDVRLAQLDELHRRRQLGSDLVRSAHTVAGAMDIVERSIARTGNGVVVSDLDLDPTGGLQEIALSLLGIPLARKEADDDDDADPTGSPGRVTGSPTRP